LVSIELLSIPWLFLLVIILLLTDSRLCRINHTFLCSLFAVDLGRKTALVHFLLFLLLERLSDFLFFFAGLLPNSPLLLIHVNNDLILHVKLVPLQILLGDQKVRSFFVVEFFYELVICLVEVFSSFNLVYFARLFKFLRVLLLWLDTFVICIDKVLMLVKFLKDLLVA
jgi:hypothetical protein